MNFMEFLYPFCDRSVAGCVQRQNGFTMSVQSLDHMSHAKDANYFWTNQALILLIQEQQEANQITDISAKSNADAPGGLRIAALIVRSSGTKYSSSGTGSGLHD
jgi:hypothetical protein